MKLSAPAKRMVLVIGASSLVMMGAGAVYYRSFSALLFAAGVLILTVLNVGKVFLMERAAIKAVELESGGTAKSYLQTQYFFRFLLTGLVFIAPMTLAKSMDDPASIWGSLAGVFTLQIAAFSAKLVKPEDEKPEEEGDRA